MLREKNERGLTRWRAISLLVLVSILLNACGNNRRFDSAVVEK